MNHVEFVESKKREIVAVSKSILAGDMDMIEGVRKICALRTLLDKSEDEIFISIRAIDSETDHFPGPNQRNLWATESLQRLDSELNEYLASAGGDILEACREIIAAFPDRSVEIG